MKKSEKRDRLRKQAEQHLYKCEYEKAVLLYEDCLGLTNKGTKLYYDLLSLKEECERASM